MARRYALAGASCIGLWIVLELVSRHMWVNRPTVPVTAGALALIGILSLIVGLGLLLAAVGAAVITGIRSARERTVASFLDLGCWPTLVDALALFGTHL